MKSSLTEGQKMKVLFLSSDLRATGGIQQYQRNLVGVLRGMSLDLEVIEFISDKVFPRLKYSLKAFWNVLYNDPDLIICGHVNFSVLGYIFKVLFGKRFVLLTYGLEVWDVKSRLRRFFIKSAHRIVTISEFTKNKILAQIFLPPARIVMVPSDIDLDRFQPAGKSAELLLKLGAKNRKIILTVARLSSLEQKKGYDQVVRALPSILKKIPDAIYVIGGDGDDLPRVKAIVAENKLEDYVIFPGRIPDHELADYYNICDVFAMPSTGEGFGIVFLEALSCGKIVIAGNVDGSREAVFNGEGGLLINPASLEEISDAVIRALNKNVPSYLLDSVKIREKIKKTYGSAVLKKNVEHLINSCADRTAISLAESVIYKKSVNLEAPTSLPQTTDEANRWQDANASWWQKNPMSYDWREEIPYKEFTKEFYGEVDRRFFANAKEYMPWKKIPFDAIIDFEGLKNKDVLEIGVGNGSHAHLLAPCSKSFVGVDITDYAVESSSKRFGIFKLNGKILKMDGERLGFPDSSFDFIWAWGVIHHSSNTYNVLKEINRVLRPGGEAIIMVYHRGWWNYYTAGLVRGLVFGDLFRLGSLHKVVQGRTDGAIARYYRTSEWQRIAGVLFKEVSVKIFGPKGDIILLPSGPIKNFLVRIFPRALSRLLTTYFRMGGFLVSVVKK